MTFHTICALAAAREVAGPFHEIFEMREIFAPAARPAARTGARQRHHIPSLGPAAASKPLKGTTLSCGTGSPGDQERSFDQMPFDWAPASGRARVVGVGASLISVKFHEKSSSEWSASRGAGAPRGMYQNNLFHEMLLAPLKFHEIS